MPDSVRTVVCTCTNGAWKIDFVSKPGDPPYTNADLFRLQRSLTTAYRAKTQQDLHKRRLEAELKAHAKALEPKSSSKS